LFPKRTNVSMPHGKTQSMLVYSSLNVTFVEAPPSTNLQQNTQYPHGIVKYIIGVFYLNSRSEYFGICTTWWNNNNGLKVNSRTNLEIIGPKMLNP